MARKTKKLNEDALTNEMKPQQAPVAQQATPEEVANAQAAAAPQETAPITADQTEPTMDTSVADPLSVDPTEAPEDAETPEEMATISSDEMASTTPADAYNPPFPGAMPIAWTTKDNLGAAVAMATGDMEAAGTAPDVAPSVTGDDILAAEDANPNQSEIVSNANVSNDLVANNMNALTPEEQEVILEYRKFKANKYKLVEETDPITGTSYEGNEDEDDIVSDVADAINEVVDNIPEEDDVKVEYKVDSKEDDAEEEDITEEDDVDALPDEVEINDDLMDSIKDFLGDFEGDSDIPEALRDTADFLDDLLGTEDDDEDDEEEAELEEVEEGEEAEGEDTDEESIENADESADATEMEDEDMEEDNEEEENAEDDVTPEEFSKKVEKKMAAPYRSKIRRYNEDSIGGIKYPTGSQPLNNITPASFADQSTQPAAESMIASKAPIHEPSANFADSNLVKSYESEVQKRRKALREYREALKSAPEPENFREKTSKNTRKSNTYNPRFREALNSSSRISDRFTEEVDRNSWQANKFLDKFEESSKLDFQQLLEDGFLG